MLKNRIIIGIVLISFIALSNAEVYILEDMSTNQGSKEINVNDDVDNTQLRPSDSWSNFSFIHIKDNWSTAAGYDWCSGDGTWSNPYVIENMTIDVANSPTGVGILIEDSVNDYFIIRNCTLFSSEFDVGTGIELLYTNNGSVNDNNCSKLDDGIFIDNSNNITINDNYLKDCHSGLYLLNSDNNNVSSNRIINCPHGMTIMGWGIIGVFDSFNNVIIDNNFTNSGIYFGMSLNEAITHTVDTSNKINSRKYYLYVNESNLNTSNFTDAGQVCLYSCNNTIIINQNLSKTSNPVLLLNCNNITISNNNMSYSSRTAIRLMDSSNNTINNNTIEDVYSIGINLESGCKNNTVFNNTISLGNEVISIGGISIGGDNNKIINNSMLNCGLSLFPNHLNNLIENNEVNNKPLYFYRDEMNLGLNNLSNAGQVILINCNNSILKDQNISSCTQGLTMYYCHNWTISNITSRFNELGIGIHNGTKISVRKCNVSDNWFGIIVGSIDNLIFYNNTAFNNDVDGIKISNCYNSSIDFNHAFNNKNGLEINSVDFSNITENIMENNTRYGMDISFLNNSLFINIIL